MYVNVGLIALAVPKLCVVNQSHIFFRTGGPTLLCKSYSYCSEPHYLKSKLLWAQLAKKIEQLLALHMGMLFFYMHFNPLGAGTSQDAPSG